MRGRVVPIPPIDASVSVKSAAVVVPRLYPVSVAYSWISSLPATDLKALDRWHRPASLSTWNEPLLVISLLLISPTFQGLTVSRPAEGRTPTGAVSCSLFCTVLSHPVRYGIRCTRYQC